MVAFSPYIDKILFYTSEYHYQQTLEWCFLTTNGVSCSWHLEKPLRNHCSTSTILPQKGESGTRGENDRWITEDQSVNIIAVDPGQNVAE